MSEKEDQQAGLLLKAKAKISELDTVLAKMPGHVYWLDRNNIYLGCNELQAEQAKLRSRYDIVGKTNSDMIWKHHAKLLDSRNLKVMESGEPYIGEEKAKLKTGEYTFLTQKVPLENDKGEIIGVLGVSFDITDRKRMESELKEARDVAVVANQMKTEFIRNLEHDIRTPLCGIKSVIAYLEQIENDPKKKEFLIDIDIASNELLNYLDNIVEFSQINTGTIPLLLKEFNLEQTMRGIINMEVAAARGKNLDLQVIYADDVPRIVIGDRFRLHRVLLNLVSNAIKFTDQGFVKLSVNVTQKISAEDLVLEFRIQDTGVGISNRHEKVIYDKFTRCDSSNRGIYKGTGLGLWVVKQFIEELSGSIELDSELDKGSVFTCKIPFKIP